MKQHITLVNIISVFKFPIQCKHVSIFPFHALHKKKSVRASKILAPSF